MAQDREKLQERYKWGQKHVSIVSLYQPTLPLSYKPSLG